MRVSSILTFVFVSLGSSAAFAQVPIAPPRKSAVESPDPLDPDAVGSRQAKPTELKVVPQHSEEEGHSEWIAPMVLGGSFILLGSAAGAAIATGTDSSRFSRTFAESALGSGVGAFGNTLIMAGGECLITSDDPGVIHQMRNGLCGAGLVLGAILGPPLTAVGTQIATLPFAQGSHATYWETLGGAYLGAGIGLAMHLVICAITKNESARFVSRFLAVGFAGGGASWAYHNSGTGAY